MVECCNGDGEVSFRSIMAALARVGAVKGLVYDAVFKRARDIAASDKLRAVVFDGEGLVKGTAECVGSSPSDLYLLSFSIDGPTAVGECSCPAGKSANAGLCKHVVALLLRRSQEMQDPKTGSWESLSEQLVVSIAFHVDDDILTSVDARESAHGSKAMAQRTDTAGSASKRALPAWMLGVGDSAAAQIQSKNKPKPNRRAAEPMSAHPPAPPPKRARRPGQSFKISSDSDEGEEDPGEVHDVESVLKCSAPVGTEDDEAPETIDRPSEGAVARERRRLKALKKEAAVSDDKGKEETKRTRTRSRRAVTNEGVDQPVCAAKRKWFSKKYVTEDLGSSENGAAPVDARNGVGLTAEELLFLAKEHLEKEKAKEAAEGPKSKAPPDKIEVENVPENSSQEKKSASIFSRNKWTELPSEGRGTGGASSVAADDLDWETLKNYSLGASSQSMSQFDRPSLSATDASDRVDPVIQATGPAAATHDVPMSMPAATGSDDMDAVTNDMLNIFFGPTLSQVSAKDVLAANSSPRASQDKLNYFGAEVAQEAPTAPFSVLGSVSVDSTVPEVMKDLSDLGVEPKPKKKSSLKDRVKMFLS